MKIRLEETTTNPEVKIAQAGGISHKNQIEDLEEARALNRKLLQWGHLSPFEFASATFYLEGVSRSCLAQLTRHRLASFMVESQRYNQYPSFEFVVPQTLRELYTEDPYIHSMIQQFKNCSQYVYDELLEHDIPPEDARFFLPIGTATSLYIKANFREWRHIFDLRTKEDAQWEIREVSRSCLESLFTVAPSVFEDQYKEMFFDD